MDARNGAVDAVTLEIDAGAQLKQSVHEGLGALARIARAIHRDGSPGVQIRPAAPSAKLHGANQVIVYVQPYRTVVACACHVEHLPFSAVNASGLDSIIVLSHGPPEWRPVEEVPELLLKFIGPSPALRV